MIYPDIINYSLITMQTIVKISPQIKPAYYFPVDKQGFNIGPGLYKLGKDFGNGRDDAKLFQVDSTFERYRNNILGARTECVDKYICHENLAQNLVCHLNRFFLQRLTAEYPDYFVVHDNNDNAGLRLDCRLTGESLHFNHQTQLQDVDTALDIPYQDAWDAWGSQLQEDLALVHCDGKQNRTAALHLCAANHWGAQQKLGQDFLDIHKPVPGFSQRYPSEHKLLDTLIHKGPFVRFAWGLATDTRLNHHPDAPQGVDQDGWGGRQFLHDSPELYLRIERQCLFGMPDINCILFTIRTYFLDVAQLQLDQLALLKSALTAMEGAAKHYKGLSDSYSAIMVWLNYLSEKGSAI